MTLAQRYTALPRAARWLIIGLGVVVLYFLILEPVLNQYNRVAAKVQSRSQTLAAYERDKEQIKAAGATVRVGVSRYGNVSFEFSEKSDARVSEFNEAVASILRKHGVSQVTRTARPATLGSGPLLTAVGPAYRVERLINEYQFEAEPETVTAVVADMERTPLVSSVSRVQMRKGDARDGRRVKATIAAELWSRTPKGKTR